MTNILVVEDNPGMRARLVGLLQTDLAGAVVGAANDGPSALALFKQSRWDVVVLDISLPGESGIRVLEKLRALSPRLLAARALLALCIAACFGLAELAGRGAAATLGATAVLLLQQTLVFAATTLRAACFALALRRLQM